MCGCFVCFVCACGKGIEKDMSEMRAGNGEGETKKTRMLDVWDLHYPWML